MADLPLEPGALLAAARTRLTERKVMSEDGTLSIRLPATGEMLFLAPGSAAAPTTLRLGWPPRGESKLHRLIYQARNDVGAVLVSRQFWSPHLAAAGGVMPGIFDEQLRHLGWRVAALAATADDAAMRRALAGGANALIVGELTFCLGMTLERLVFNAELLEKCAQAFVLARATGLPVRQIPWLVRWIATGRLRRDQRRAARRIGRGQMPERVAGY